MIATLEARVKDGEEEGDRVGDLTVRPSLGGKVQGRNVHIEVCLLDGWISGKDGPVGHLEAETYQSARLNRRRASKASS